MAKKPSAKPELIPVSTFPLNGEAAAVDSDVMQADFIAVPPTTTGQRSPRRTPKDTPLDLRIITWQTRDAAPKGRRGKLVQPEYDLSEIAKATDTDELFRTAFDRHVNCIMKEGWSLSSRNTRARDYVDNRLREFGAMNHPFEMVLRQAAQDLVEYSNFFVYLHRDESKSSGSRTKIRGKNNVEPTAALFNIDPTTMFPKMGDTLLVQKWFQMLPENGVSGRSFSTSGTTSGPQTKQFSTRDILHGYWRRRTGFIFGTPMATPVLDDIRALRRLEEISELIAHKHAFPFVHVKVGTDKIPAKKRADGTSEVDMVAMEYQTLPLEGAFITSERVTVTPVDTKPMDLVPLLQHYHSRAMSGLGISDIDIGKGGTANRGTAESLSRNMMDRCREFQSIISLFFSTQIFDILLLEGGFELNPDTRVTLQFPDVDIDRQMAINNHAMALYQGHMVSEEEARGLMGRDPVEEGVRDGMFMQVVEKPKMVLEASLAPTPAVNGSASNANQPKNQSGKKAAKTMTKNAKVSAETRKRSDVAELIASLRDNLSEYIHEQVDREGVIDDRRLRKCFLDLREPFEDAVAAVCWPHIEAGMTRYVQESGSSAKLYLGQSLRSRFRRACLSMPMDSLFGDKQQSDSELIVTAIRKSTGDYMNTLAVKFEQWPDRWSRILDRLESVAAQFGYAHAAWLDNKYQVTWNFDKELCPRCFQARRGVVTPSQATYYGLMPRDCDTELTIIPDKLKGVRVPLVTLEPKIRVHEDCLLLTLGMSFPENLRPDRNHAFRVVLDSGVEAMLPERDTDGWSYDPDTNRITIPVIESGMIELWEDGKAIGRAHFKVPSKEVSDG